MEENIDLMLNSFEKIDKLHLQVVDNFESGIDADELRSQVRQFSLNLPLEVEHYFGWHNGLKKNRPSDFELFPQGVVLSLEENVEAYNQLIGISTDLKQYQPSTVPVLPVSDPFSISMADEIWPSTWFPLFSFNGAEHWFVICGEKTSVTSPIYRIYLPDSENMYLAYDSLASLLLCTAEAFSAGAYSEDGNGSVVEKRTISRSIINKHNPKRREYLFKYVNYASSFDDLLAALVDKNVHLSSRAFTALSLLGDETVVQPLLRLLTSHRQPRLRARSATLLGELGYRSAVQGLIEALKDRDYDVRYAAIYALGEIGEPSSIDPLRKLFQSNDIPTHQLVTTALQKISVAT